MFILKPYAHTWRAAVPSHCGPSVAPEPQRHLPWLALFPLSHALSFSLLLTILCPSFPLFIICPLSPLYHGPVTDSCGTWWLPQGLLCLRGYLRLKGFYPRKCFNQLFVPLKEDVNIYQEQVLLLSRSSWGSSAFSITSLIILIHSHCIWIWCS